MASNRGVVYMGPGVVEIQSIDFPKLVLGTRKCEHGVILKIVSTNICGSDQHMVRGRRRRARHPGPGRDRGSWGGVDEATLGLSKTGSGP